MTTYEYGKFYICSSCNKKIHEDYINTITEECDTCDNTSSEHSYTDEFLFLLFAFYILK